MLFEYQAKKLTDYRQSGEKMIERFSHVATRRALLYKMAYRKFNRYAAHRCEYRRHCSFSVIHSRHLQITCRWPHRYYHTIPDVYCSRRVYFFDLVFSVQKMRQGTSQMMYLQSNPWRRWMDEIPVDPATYTVVLKKTRRRRKYIFGTLLIYIPALLITNKISPTDRAMGTLFVIWVAFLIIFASLAATSKCPRCGNYFHINGITLLFLRKCLHCQLHINADKTGWFYLDNKRPPWEVAFR